MLIGDGDLFTSEVGLYDTAGMPGAARYTQRDKAGK